MAESTTRCGSENNTFGGLERETSDVLVTSETLGLKFPADGWKGCAGRLHWASLPISCKMRFFDFALVEVVPKRQNRGFGRSTA
jgi:hypothetical protein